MKGFVIENLHFYYKENPIIILSKKKDKILINYAIEKKLKYFTCKEILELIFQI